MSADLDEVALKAYGRKAIVHPAEPTYLNFDSDSDIDSGDEMAVGGEGTVDVEMEDTDTFDDDMDSEERQENVYRWFKSHPNYMVLDEYIRWDESTRGGKGNHNNRNLLVHLCNLFTTIAGNKTFTTVQDGHRIDDFRGHNPAGPSVLRRVWDLLDYHDQSSLRLATRYIAPHAAQWRGEDLRIRADSMYQSERLNRVSKLQDFIDWNYSRPPPKSPAVVGDVMLQSEHVKKITFTRDSRQEKYRWSTIDALRQKEAFAEDGSNEDEFQVAVTNTVAREFDINELVATKTWQGLLKSLSHFTALVAFSWEGHAPVHRYIVPTLSMHAPQLRSLHISISGLVLDDSRYSLHIMGRSRRHVWGLSKANINTLTLRSQVEASIQITSREWASQIESLTWLTKWVPSVQVLKINNDHPAITHVLYEEGPASTERRIPVKSSALTVHNLVLDGVGDMLRSIIAYVNPGRVQALSMRNCLYIGPVVENLLHSPLASVHLEPLKWATNRRGTQTHDRYAKFRHQMIRDKRDALDFLRCATFKLKKLSIIGQFTDDTRQPRAKPGLAPDLFFAVQTHLESLNTLTVINEGTDFLKEELEEIGQCAPNLIELRIQSRMAPRVFEVDQSEPNEGLSYALKDAFQAFCRYRTLRAFCVQRSVTNNFFTKGITPDQAMQVDTISLAVESAREQGVPIQLFSYFEGINENEAQSGHHFAYSKHPDSRKGSLRSVFRGYDSGAEFSTVANKESIRRRNYDMSLKKFLELQEQYTDKLDIYSLPKTRPQPVRSVNKRNPITPQWPAAALGRPVGSPKYTSAEDEGLEHIPDEESDNEVEVFARSSRAGAPSPEAPTQSRHPLESRFHQGYTYKPRGMRFLDRRYRYQWSKHIDGTYVYERPINTLIGQPEMSDHNDPPSTSNTNINSRFAQDFVRWGILDTPPVYFPPPRYRKPVITGEDLLGPLPPYQPDLTNKDPEIQGPMLLDVATNFLSLSGRVRRYHDGNYYYVPPGVRDPWEPPQ